VQTRTKNLLVLIGATVVLGGGLAWAAKQAPAPRPIEHHAIDAIPAGAMVVATGDLKALRASEVGAPLLQQGREIPGLGKVTEVCGFDPVDSLKEVAIAIPMAGDQGEFGLAGIGDVDDEAVLNCARKAIEARGGRPVVTRIGSFRSVHDAANEAGGGELAVRKGTLLLSGGTYLRAMIDAADDRTPTVRSSKAHSMLSKEVGDGALRVTGVLTPDQRRTIASEMEVSGSDSPAKTIVAGGVSVTLGREVELHAAIACEDVTACGKLGEMLRQLAAERATEDGVQLMGFGEVLKRVNVEVKEDVVHVRMKAPADVAKVLFERLIALRGISHPMPDDKAANAKAMRERVKKAAEADAQALPAPTGSASAAPRASAAPEVVRPKKDNGRAP
jgi:hypothetical protein